MPSHAPSRDAVHGTAGGALRLAELATPRGLMTGAAALPKTAG